MPQALAEELKSIPMSPNLGESLERAHRFAREQSHRFVMLEHLLLALAEDPEASLILQAANVDLPQLATDVSGYLGGLMEDMRSGGGEPRPDPELLRVLQAAASAAQQSKRRQIDGAIVLAAVVGDGKSPAAGLLKKHGMTFEEAIRALQRANTKARLKPIAKPQPAAPTSPAVVAPAPVAEDPAPANMPIVEEAPSVAASPRIELPEEPAPAKAAPAGVQSADDILAAARARIQRRAAALGQAPDAPYFSGPPAKDAALQPQTGQASAPRQPADDVSDAMRELLVASGVEAPSQIPPPGPERIEHLNDAAEPAPRDTVVPLRPAAVQQRFDRPAEMHPAQPSQRPAPQPAPQHLAPVGMPVQAPMPNGAMRGPMHDRLDPPPPWPGPVAAAPQQQVAPPASRPAKIDKRQLTRASAPLPPLQGQQRKASGAQERGPLVEAIPRRMRIDVTSEGEVRIAQDRIETLVAALAGRGGSQMSEPVVMRALTVRLRAQDGDFFIEPLAPETQWLETNPHAVHEEPLTWRWAITPRERGKGKLVLLVAMRTIGIDGASEEVGPPDRIVEIKVRGRVARTILRRLFWLAAFVGVFMLGRIGGDLGPLLLRTIRQVTGL